MKIRRAMGRILVGFLLSVALGQRSSAEAQENPAAVAARQWRQTNEWQILAEYLQFLRIPNVSRDISNVRRNAEHLVQMMEKRGLHPRLLEVDGAPPLVYGELLSPGATATYVFYAHYDGQPVDPKEWATPPFEPALRTARLDKGGEVSQRGRIFTFDIEGKIEEDSELSKVIQRCRLRQCHSERFDPHSLLPFGVLLFVATYGSEQQGLLRLCHWSSHGKSATQSA